MCFQSALQLHKVWNRDTLNFESVSMIDQITLTSRQTLFIIFRNNTTRIGMNTTANKFYQLTSKINLETLNLSFIHLKKNYENSISKIWQDLNKPPSTGPYWNANVIMVIRAGACTMSSDLWHQCLSAITNVYFFINTVSLTVHYN